MNSTVYMNCIMHYRLMELHDGKYTVRTVTRSQHVGRCIIRLVLFAAGLKGVDTDNAARCIPTQSCPKHGFGKLRCLSLYEQILGWARPHSKEEGSVQRAPGHGLTRLC